MKNTISLILLHSTYPICQQILLALPSKYSQNLTTSHCHPCPSHDPSTAGFLHPLRSPCDCPCCLGSVPNTVTWKSDHVAFTLQVRSRHSSTQSSSHLAQSKSCILSSIPQDLVQSHPLTSSLISSITHPSLPLLQTELIPCSSLTTAGMLWLQNFCPPHRSLCQEHSFAKTNVARLLGSFPKCRLLHEAFPAHSF